MDAAIDTLGYSTRKHQEWIGSNDAEIQKVLIKWNARFAAKLRNPTSVDLHHRWALHCSQVQKLPEMENIWRLSNAIEIQNYADTSAVYQIYDTVKGVKSPKSHSMHPVCTKDGTTLIKDRKGILSCWVKHIEEWLNQANPLDQSIVDQLLQLPTVSELDIVATSVVLR